MGEEGRRKRKEIQGRFLDLQYENIYVINMNKIGVFHCMYNVHVLEQPHCFYVA